MAFMNILNNDLVKVIFTGLVLFQLNGCNAEDHVQVSNEAVTSEAKGSSHRYPGKPQAAVDIDYQVETPFVVGERSNVTIVFTSKRPADELSVSINSDESQLQISGAQSGMSFGPQQAGQSNSVELDVVPQNQGLYYIHINARLSAQGSTTSKSYAIPVNTATGDMQKQMKPAGKIIRDHNGQRLLIMPATEKPE